jgi:tRNA modification GTPase
MLVCNDPQPDTIFALSTPPGRAALSVVRVSGARARQILEQMSGALPEPRRATLTKLRDPSNTEVIDHGLVYWFPAPHSFTGEDCAELSIHGSRAVVAKTLEVIARIPGTRIAAAGEFTRRALQNGKIDLIEVEALGDLISAETEQQRLVGIAGLSGKFQTAIMEFRAQLISILASVESSLDFSDEQDVLAYDADAIIERCNRLQENMAIWLKSKNRGEILRSGFTILISGPPNAGKSTLINELARRELAIVSHLPGTTRDLLEVQIDLNGYLVNFIDSAGIRVSSDEIESIGINRAIERGKTADLVLWLCDHRERVEPHPDFRGSIVWPIYTKCDIGAEGSQIGTETGSVWNDEALAISAVSGYHIEELLTGLTEFVAANFSWVRDDVIINARQRHALGRALEALEGVRECVGYPEIVATKLREAMFELEVLVGSIGVEDVLGEIFSNFCIGK